MSRRIVLFSHVSIMPPPIPIEGIMYHFGVLITLRMPLEWYDFGKTSWVGVSHIILLFVFSFGVHELYLFVILLL